MDPAAENISGGKMKTPRFSDNYIWAGSLHNLCQSLAHGGHQEKPGESEMNDIIVQKTGLQTAKKHAAESANRMENKIRFTSAPMFPGR